MGLINKIEDKLSGNKSSSKQSYEYSDSSSSPSNIRNPISSASPTTAGKSSGITGGTAVENSGYSSSHPQTTTSYNDQYSSQPTGYSTHTKSSYPGGDTTTNTTTSTTTDRQFFDPYSRKGQQTAASAATNDYGMSPSMHSSSHPNADADVARSNRGGVLNSTTAPTQDLSTASGEPALRHHYGRDPSLATGAAAGAGYGAAQYSPTTGHETDTRRSADIAGGSSTMDMPKRIAAAYEQGYRDGMEHMKQEMMQKLQGQ
jgi:hypothetical protein